MTRLECRVKKLLENDKSIHQDGVWYYCSRSPYKVKLPTEFTKELCRLLGIIHGDGNMSFSRILVSDKSLPYHKKVVCLLFKQLFGLQLHIFEDKQRNTYYSHIKSKLIYKYLTEVLEVPKGSVREGLVIPTFLKRLPNHLQASYVGGIFDAEGHISKRQAMASVYTTDKPLFEFVKCFLRKNCITFSVYERSRRKNREYEIYIYGKARLMQLHKLIDIRHPEKLHRYNMFSVH